MKWDDLQFVLAIAKEQTLSRAASVLGVTHTTAGRRLRGLEEHLGVRLFDRTPEGFVPTKAGIDVVESARRMETEALAMEARVLGQGTELRGKIRVATMDIFLHAFGPLFRSFVQSYPDVDLTLTSSDAQVSLTRREADVVLRMTDTPPDYLVGRRVGQVGFGVYGAKSLVEKIGPDAGYSAYPWIGWDERLNMRWFDGWLSEHAPGAQVVLRMDVSSGSRRHAVSSGVGVGFLSCLDADADPELVRIGPVHRNFGRHLWLLTMPDLVHTSRIRAFLDHMMEGFADYLDAIEGQDVRPSPTS